MAPKPGVIPLRPIGLGEILDGAFTSVRRNPKATIGLAAIVMLISGLISGGAYALAFNDLHGMNLQTGQHITGAQFRHIFSVLLPTYGITILLTFLMAELLTGMLTAVIGRGVLGRHGAAGAPRTQRRKGERQGQKQVHIAALRTPMTASREVSQDIRLTSLPPL